MTNDKFKVGQRVVLNEYAGFDLANKHGHIAVQPFRNTTNPYGGPSTVCYMVRLDSGRSLTLNQDCIDAEVCQ